MEQKRGLRKLLAPAELQLFLKSSRFLFTLLLLSSLTTEEMKHWINESNRQPFVRELFRKLGCGSEMFSK